MTTRPQLIHCTRYCIPGDSGDLGMAIQRKASLGQSFTENQIMEWTIQLLLALRYLHDRKVPAWSTHLGHRNQL
jgi:serine/threonine protein kinase